MSNSQTLVLTGLCLLGVLLCVFVHFYNRWHHARGMRRAHENIERLRREEEAGIPPSPSDYHHAISFDAEGVTVANLRSRTDKPSLIRWPDISRATVFKRDHWSTDCICLFLARDDGLGVELNEEMAKWRTFVGALPNYLQGCLPPDEWFATVALPAFEPNPTEIYLRGVCQPA